MSKTQIDEDLARIAGGLDELKVQYDQFLAGALDREPLAVRRRIESLIRRCNTTPLRTYAQTFHLNTLVSRFNSYVELWTRQVKAMEEGRGPAGRPREQRDQSGGDRESRTLLSTRISDAGSDQVLLRDLYRTYLERSRSLTGRAVRLDYTRFHRQVSRQMEGLREKHGCSTVEFRLVFDGSRVRLRARPAETPERIPSQESPS
jgi:hypothetical protein